MKNNVKKTNATEILKDSPFGPEILNDIKNLTVEDVVVVYAYAEAIVETVREPLVILDKDLRIKTANKSFFETFKVNKRETYNKLIFNLGNGQWDIPQLKKLLKNILPKSTTFEDFEVNHTFESIGNRTMILNARRIILEGHKTELILLAIEDVTKRKEAETKLLESEQHYRSIVDQVRDYIIYTMDKNGIITDWNKAAEKITGYKKSDVLGKFHGLIYTPEDKKDDIPLKELTIAEKKGRAINERWHIGKGKTFFWGSGMVTPVRDDKKTIQGFSKIMRDITNRIEKEQKKDEFLSLASHELKTPLTAIKAYTQILSKRLSGTKDAKNEYFIKNINAQTDKLTSLVKDFLDVSKIEAGKFVFLKKKFNMDELIKKIIVDFQFMADNHQIKKVGNADVDLFGDKDRVGQVITNFLTNAIKYSPDGKEIIVRSKLGKDKVTVSVQDFGIGIPKNKIRYVFDKYYQVTDHGHEGKKGFGLGLYIAAEIIRRHKGEIWVKSAKGKGSIFYFSLPINS